MLKESLAPLFVVSVARSGGNLLARMLGAHSQVVVAADAFLPMYRSLRDAIVFGKSSATAHRTPEQPLSDYYFRDGGIEQLDMVQQGGIDELVDACELTSIRALCARRAAGQRSDMELRLGDLDGRTYADLFESSLRIVQACSPKAGLRWVGTKEVWTIEFIPLLARAFPTARFVVLFRDPRAVIASMLAIGRADPTSLGHPLSYARHWRKMFAFCEHFHEDPAISRRVFRVRYEDLVTNAAATVGELCSFLGIEPELSMVGGSELCGDEHEKGWRGNSSFDRQLSGISSQQNRYWKRFLDDDVKSMIQVTCSEELACLGYVDERDTVEDLHFQRMLNHLERTDAIPVSWRTDLGSPTADVLAERTRRELLEGRRPATSQQEIRRCILFPEVLDRLKGAHSRSVDGRCEREMLPRTGPRPALLRSA